MESEPFPVLTLQPEWPSPLASVAEEIVYGEDGITTGASNDLQQGGRVAFVRW